MQAIYKPRGLQEKSGEAVRERKEAHPELVSLTSATQQSDGWSAQRALLRHQGIF